ncbi:l-ornithine n5-oxygenase [Phlyctema vagabunda]|uniref:L-ornithine N(5)-monooxygenase [NAD(P)H] n=1 Tax=Phlyctema vagabunda TaxID=108571 RepID=A0ABR4P854_9HELO
MSVVTVQESGISKILKSTPYQSSAATEVQDLICVGFGPASLAIGTAIEDTYSNSLGPRPKVQFLEKQEKFAWHSGMQIPGARMQISFLKDMATPRNPNSKFTFLSYLHANNRLNHFINLDTFLPARLEYEDYLRWCASHFEKKGLVSYGQEVVEVSPSSVDAEGKVDQFRVVSRDFASGELSTRLARHVVVAVGGKAVLPKAFPQQHPRVLHSSKYVVQVNLALTDPQKPYNIVVVGNGQSAAEIFNDLPSRFPNAKVTLLIRGSALRPSDDSPFVNEVFDPDRVDCLFQKTEEERKRTIKQDLGTNYGVVRLNLLEHLYDRMYMQRLHNADPSTWKVQIKNNCEVIQSELVGDKIKITIQPVQQDSTIKREEMVVDAIFVATGYLRDSHQQILKKTKGLLPKESQAAEARFPVRRDYKVQFDGAKVAENAGVWLQGCNEATHGLSDTLLSILAVRGGEMTKSIFGDFEQENKNTRVRSML